MSSGRVRILSDLHLAHPASPVGTVAELRPLLEGMDAVVFNGDTCERNCDGWFGAGGERLAELRDLCEEEGVRPVFLTGNHDNRISEHGWLDLLNGAVMVTHGDMFHRNVAPWSREYLARKKAVREILEARGDRSDDLRFRWETTCLIEDALKVHGVPKLRRKRRLYLMSALWPPERPLAMMWAWATMFREAGEFMARYRPEARVMVFGHFHRPGVRWRDGRLLVNTGAFMRGAAPLAVDLEDGCWLRVRGVERGRGGRYFPGAGREVVRIGSGPLTPEQVGDVGGVEVGLDEE